jgi:hypothetical protein
MSKQPVPKPPLRAPDGSAITPSMAKANADFDADVKAGNITPNGVVIKDPKTGLAKNNPTGVYESLAAHADKVHPVRGQ